MKTRAKKNTLNRPLNMYSVFNDIYLKHMLLSALMVGEEKHFVCNEPPKAYFTSYSHLFFM